MIQATLLLYLTINSVVILALDPIGLKVSASLRGLLIGTAARADNLRNDVDSGRYRWTLTSNYPLIVPEGELKSQTIWIGENIYNWTEADWLLGDTENTTGWIQQNGMLLRGHNLLWAVDKRVPNWLIEQESSISPEKAKNLLSDYIHAVVGRYRGKIPWWDVVNEAIDDSNNNRTLNLKDCFWYRKLGADFMKYAFIFAHEADPDAKLYYNDYNIEYFGVKTNRTIALVDWLRSQGATIHGIGLQWHIQATVNITPGDLYYQSAQQFVNNGLDFMITELDVSIPTSGGYPVDSKDLDRQGFVYRSLVHYALYFAPHCRAMLTWGFTDRYSWIPGYSNYTNGAALPFDWMYFPKPAFRQMQEELARVLIDGTYYLIPQSDQNKCLGFLNNGTNIIVQLYSMPCNSDNEKWQINWLDDGTYRFTPKVPGYLALVAYNTSAPIGEVQISNVTNDMHEEWALAPTGNGIFRIVPRTAWWRALGIYGAANIGIVNYTSSEPQNWILTTD